MGGLGCHLRNIMHNGLDDEGYALGACAAKDPPYNSSGVPCCSAPGLQRVKNLFSIKARASFAGSAAKNCPWTLTLGRNLFSSEKFLSNQTRLDTDIAK